MRDDLLVAMATVTVAVGAALFLFGSQDASADTFTVTSGADPGDGVCDAICTLREALDEANLNAGHDVIDFDPGVFPPGVPATITPAAALPASTDSDGITIDGTGAGVIVDGGLLGGSEHGLVIQSSSAATSLLDVTVRSVIIQNFPGNGIFVCGGAADDCDESVTNVLVEDVVASGNGQHGFFTRGGESVTDVEVRDSTTSGNGFIGTFVAGGTNTGTTITGVTSSNNDSGGISVAGFISDNVDPRVTDVVTNSNGSQGISICCFDMIRPVVANVTSTGNESDNINVVGERVIDGKIEHCVANGSQSFAGINVSAAIDNLIVSNCDANDNAGKGVSVIAYDVTRMLEKASITSVTANDNGDTGIHAEATDSTITDLVIDDAGASGNGNHGIFVRGGQSVTDVRVRDSTTNGNDFRGTSVVGGINTRTVIANVTSSNNNQEGVTMAGFVADLVNSKVTNVVTNSNGSEGINFCCFDMIGTEVANAVSVGNVDANVSFVGERVIDGTVENCEANGSQAEPGIRVIAEIENLTISDCEASDNAEQGMWLWAYDTRTIDGVVISNVRAADNGTHGFEITPEDQVSDVSLVSNTLINNVSSAIEAGGPLAANFNRIFGNGVGVNNLTGTTLDVENNWWGCNAGPNSLGCNTTAGAVDADPWLTLGLASDPDPAFAMSPAEIAAGVTTNSDGADTSGEGHIHDGTVIALTTDAGSFPGAGINATTQSGEAKATLQTGDAGVAHLTATLDNETVMLDLTVVEGGPSLSPTATPTATPAAELVQGDNDCDGDVDAVDALQGLRFVAALGVNQQPDCPGLGTEVASLFGDVDCDDDVDAVDALQILRFVAALPVNQQNGCAEIGSALG